MKIPGLQFPNIKFTIIDLDDISELTGAGMINEEINIINQINSSYPFTFLEKESIRKKVDNLLNFLWIKNRYGFCELVNQRLAAYFNASSHQLEDNHEEIFFDLENQKLVKAFNNIALETKKAVRLEGVKFKDIQQIPDFDLINLPIVDYENTVKAIVTLSVPAKSQTTSKDYVNNSLYSQILSSYPEPSAIFEANGNVKNYNDAFVDFSGLSRNKIENSTINKLFSSEFNEIFHNFLTSKANNLEIEIEKLFVDKPNSVKISLGKIFEENRITAVLLTIINEIEKQQAQNIGNQKNMIESIFKNNPEAVLICDKENLKFLDVNDKAIELYGYSKDEFLKMDLTDLFLTEDVQILSEFVRTNTKEGVFYGPYKHKQKNGSVILVEMSSFSIKYLEREAHFNMIKKAAEDLRENKLSQSYRNAFDSISDLLFVVDSAGIVKHINLPVTKILGFTKSDLINSSINKIITDESRSSFINLIQQSEKSTSSSVFIYFKSIEGKPIPTEVTAIPILDSSKNIQLTIVTCKIKESLAAEFGKDSKVERSISEIGKANLPINSKFLSELFHELLTPINVILGFSEELIDGSQEIKGEQNETASLIKQNRSILLQTMNRALEYASLLEQISNLSITEIKITEMVSLLEKDLLEVKDVRSIELAYGRISSSLKFESDSKRFRTLLFLLVDLVSHISTKKKIYFSAYSQDKDTFLTTFRDSANQSSNHLVNELNKIFLHEEESISSKLGYSRIVLELVKMLLVTLGGKYKVLSDEKSAADYCIIFPLKFSQHQIEELTDNKVIGKQTEDLSQNEKPKPELVEDKTSEKTQPTKITAEIQNEMKLEALRQKIKKKEAETKPDKFSNQDEQEEEEIADLLEDKIKFIDIDIKETSPAETNVKDEFEIVKTSPDTEAPAEPPQVIHTDEKVDISKLTCLYFEDQIDSQILFSIQMKGLKDLKFAVSFEEGLPLLESGTFDFILIDINLHGSYNGLDVLRILRTMPKFENTPIFAATAYTLPGDQQKFIAAGFNGFISKPIFRDQMIDLLAEVFNQPQQT